MWSSETSIKKVVLFYNPKSGNGMFKNHLDLIIRRFQEKGNIVVPIRAGNENALENLFKLMNPKEFDKVIVAGGDGTINVCVNLMLKYDIDLPLAILPAGTANDFAYHFELSTDLGEMLDIALGDKFTQVDIGKVNGKYFINVTALGTLVDVSQKTDPNLKNTLGILSYYLRGIMEVKNLKPIPIRLTSEEFTGDVKMLFMLVMNGRSAGGFKKISPRSEVNDGLLDVMVFKNMPPLEFAPLFIRILQGEHQENKNVIYFKTNDLTVESEQFVSTDFDGEKGEPLPLKFSVLPKKLKVMVR